MEHDELRLEALLTALNAYDVRYIVTGSVAAMTYGVKITPNDLDIAPALDSANLERLARLLRDLHAKPKHVPSWRRGLSQEECERWQPEPAKEENLDHRFLTAHGELDVVPRGAGEYQELIGRALHTAVSGVPVRVVHLDDLIALSRKWDRETDRRRLPELLEARSRLPEL